MNTSKYSHLDRIICNICIYLYSNELTVNFLISESIIVINKVCEFPSYLCFHSTLYSSIYPIHTTATQNITTLHTYISYYTHHHSPLQLQYLIKSYLYRTNRISIEIYKSLNATKCLYIMFRIDGPNWT